MDQSDIYDYLTFRRMLTPAVIQIVFWVAVAVVIVVGLIGALISLVTMVRGAFLPGLMALFMNLATMTLGPIAIRIYCELIIVFFRMNETLTEIKNNTAPVPSNV